MKNYFQLCCNWNSREICGIYYELNNCVLSINYHFLCPQPESAHWTPINIKIHRLCTNECKCQLWKRLIDFFLKYIAWYQFNCTFKRNCNLRILLVILAQFWCKGNVAFVFMIHKKFSCTYKHWRLSSFSQIHFGWRTVLRWTSTRCHFRNRNRWATTN